VGILIMTDYQIVSNFQDKLKVVSIVGDALSGSPSV
jgi:two-component system sensor histidine kinase EvgS